MRRTRVKREKERKKNTWKGDQDGKKDLMSRQTSRAMSPTRTVSSSSFLSRKEGLTIVHVSVRGPEVRKSRERRLQGWKKMRWFLIESLTSLGKPWRELASKFIGIKFSR
jgi:hypothetical protein